jgi:hypothetical protein
MDDPVCKKRGVLLDSYFKATADLIRMNRAFSNAVVTPGGPEAIGAVWGDREAARRLCEDIRRQIYEHVQTHGCGSFDPTMEAKDSAA